MAPTHADLVAHRDDRRFRELYRYFQPTNAAAVLYEPHVSSAEGPSNSIPSIEKTAGGNSLAVSLMPPQDDLASPNTILTTFAQLAAHKLNVERAIIWYAKIFHLIFPQPREYNTNVSLLFSVLGRDTEYILAEAASAEQTSTQSLWAGYGSDGRFGPKLNLVSISCRYSRTTL